MTLDVEELKAAHLCSVLSNKKWKYQRETQEEILIKDLIHAAVCWLGKRDNHMAWQTLQAMTGYQTADLSPQEAANIHAVIKDFYHNHYMSMVSPLGRHPLKLNMEGCVLEGTVPIIAYKDVDKPTKHRIEFILLEGTSSINLFMKNTLVRFISIWATSQIEQRYKIININVNDDNSLIEFEPTGAYVENSRKVLKSMIKSKPKMSVFPSEEVCKGCQHLEVCPV